MVKWFSIITPAGEKFYFNFSKLRFLKNNCDETLKGLAAVQKKKLLKVVRITYLCGFAGAA